jgi:hypothetical protein
MSARRLAATLGLLGFAFAAPVLAQGLGDSAARERAKRAAQAKKDPGKSFTNEDLEAGRPPGSKPSADSSSDAQAASEQPSEPAAAPPEDRLAEERPYLDAIIAARAEVTAAESRIKELSDKLNPMSVNFIYGAGGSNDANEELRVREELRQAERDMQAARLGVDTANQNLQAFRQGRPVSRPE